MGAHVMDGGSYYQSEAAPLGPVDASEKLRIRVKLQKAGEPNEEVAREALSSDLILGIVSDRDARAHHLSNGELADDRDKHIQSENRHGFPVKMEKNVADNHVEDSGSSEIKSEVERPPTCVECGKPFPSLKALYGHLRCHPHRGYRGANRPPESKNKLQEGFDSSSDRVLPTANWSVTAKRGRKGIIESQDPEANAASILMQLSRAYIAGPTPTPSRETDPYRKKATILDDMRVEMHSANTDGNEYEYTHEMEADDDGHVEASSSRLAVQRKAKKKKIKHLDSVHEASPPTRGRRYRCSTCDKTFSTHQALGGHRASHNKNKSSSEEVVVMDEAEDDDPAHTKELVDPNGAAPRAATAEHRCTLCQATFRTGQALGGHKRRHWNGPVNHRPPSPPAPSPVPSSESVVKKANNGLLDFDLNELPKLEAEFPMV